MRIRPQDEGQTKQYAKEELDRAKVDRETILDLIIKNAREGRFGSTKLTDPDKLDGKIGASAGGIKPMTTAGVEAARTEISQARNELSAVVGGSDSSTSGANDARETLDQLNETLSSNRTLLRHV